MFRICLISLLIVGTVAAETETVSKQIVTLTPPVIHGDWVHEAAKRFNQRDDGVTLKIAPPSDDEKQVRTDFRIVHRCHPMAWERDSKAQKISLASRGLVLLVHPDCPLDRLSSQQVHSLFGYIGGKGDTDPLEAHGLRYAFDGWDRSVRRTRKNRARHHYRDLLERIASDPKLLGWTKLQSTANGFRQTITVRDSGLKQIVISGPPSDKLDMQELILVAPARPSPAMKAVIGFLKQPEIQRLLPVTYVPRPAPAKQTVWPTPDTKAVPTDYKVALAVLPVRQLSRHWQMATPTVKAGLDDAIDLGLRQSGHQTFVDRVQLERLMRERRLDLLTSQKSHGALLSARICLLPVIVTREGNTFLKLDAFHAGTATRLGILEQPLPNRKWSEFSVDLSEQISKWWPGVMKNYRRVNQQPIVSLSMGSAQAESVALRRVHTQIDQALSQMDSIFYARYHQNSFSQQEVLLAVSGLTGVSTDMSIASDLQVTLLEKDDAVFVRFGRPDQPRTSILIPWSPKIDFAELLARQRVTKLDRTNSAQWARVQAAEQFRQGKKLESLILSIRKEAMRRKGEARKQGIESAGYLPGDAERRDSLRKQMEHHFQRAVHLDPTNQKYASHLVRHDTSESYSYKKLTRFVERNLRFIRMFPDDPNSYRACEMLNVALHELHARPEIINIPADVDIPSHRRACCEINFEVLAQWIKRTDQGPANRRVGRLGNIGRYYRGILGAYGKLVSPEQLSAAINKYGQLADARPEELVHSDFCRLQYLAQKNLRVPYAELVRKLQGKYNDPKHRQWQLSESPMTSNICRLFHMDSQTSSLWLWLKGKRGPGDIPFVGYDPDKPLSRFGLRMHFAPIGKTATAVRALLQANRALKSKQPGISFRLELTDQNKRPWTLQTALRDGRFVLIQGELSRAQRQTLRRIYHTQPIPLHEIGTFPDSSGKSVGLSILEPPRRSDGRGFVCYLEFLHSSAGRVALKKAGITPVVVTPQLRVIRALFGVDDIKEYTP